MTDLDDLVAEWQLRADGAVVESGAARVVPVRSQGIAAVLKISLDPEAEHEHLVLRRWNGSGAVRLLRADPHRRAVLLERQGPRTLDSLRDVDACEVVAELYRRLHVPATPQLRTLTSCLDEWAEAFRRLPRSAPIPRRLVEQVITLCGHLGAATGERVVHGNLHYGNVLSADREPWLSISPTPLAGDPHYEIAPMLWHRWDELGRNVRFGVQRRFYALVDAAGFDEDRARSWVLVRVVREAVRILSANADPAGLTRFVTLAKAIQD